MIAGPQYHEVEGEQEGPDARWLSPPVVPSQCEPRDCRDHGHTHRIDLFVRGGLVPDGEGGRPHHRAACGAHREHPPLLDRGGQHPVPNQKEEKRSDRTRGGGQEVDSDRYGQTQWSQQKAPYPCNTDEKRIPRRVRDTQKMPRRDVLACVPPSRRGRQRQDVKAEDRQPQQRPFPVRWSVSGHSYPCKNFVSLTRAPAGQPKYNAWRSRPPHQ